MSNLRTLRILYQAKNNATGLTDVKGQVYLNDIAKAVGVSALVFTELDASNSPGAYYLDISPATLTGYGVTEGGTNVLYAVINSVTRPAEAIFKTEIEFDNDDDIYLRLGAPAGASVSADIAAVLTAIQAVQNNAGFAVPVPSTLIIPGSGSNVYRIPVTTYNEKNQLIDPDSNTITVALVNQAGTDRSSYLSSTTMTRDSLGQYHVDVTILSSAPQEELLFTFSYAIAGVATARRAVSETITDVNADGFALQSTLLNVQSTVNTIETQATEIASDTDTIITNLAALQTDVTNNVEGAGFSNATDSLHQISVYMTTNLFQGGRAV